MDMFGRIGARLYGLLYRNPRSNRIVVEAAELTADDRGLEVGCGPGAAVALAAERIGADRVHAIDPSPTFVNMVRTRVPGADVRVGRAEDPPFPDQSFTVIWSIASMHHWPDRDTGLAALIAKLLPAGRLLIAERLLARPGHGITRDGIADVSATLSDLGCTVDTFERRHRRQTFAIIRATRRNQEER